LSELWVPGVGAPEEFVRRLRNRIEAFAEAHGNAVVEIELRDGSIVSVSAIEPEPGFGFVTLVPHGEEPHELIVPLGAVARIRLMPESEQHPLGFST
jgi:hypothetical protein